MKKTYITPTTEAIAIEQTMLTSMSMDSTNKVTNENQILGRDFDFDDDEEYE